MRGLCRYIIGLIIRANSRSEKTETLEELVETCEMREGNHGTDMDDTFNMLI